jgi:hypothetical protein
MVLGCLLSLSLGMLLTAPLHPLRDLHLLAHMLLHDHGRHVSMVCQLLLLLQ